MVKFTPTIRGGRTKLKLDEVPRVAKIIGNENDMPQAAASIGVTAHTVRNWMRRGESSSEEPFRSLFLAVKREQLKAIEALHAQGDNHAAMGNNAGVNWVKWKLAKFFPKQYADKETNSNADDDHDDISNLSTDELVERARRFIGGEAIDVDSE